MKYSNLTWGLLAVMAVLMVAAVGQNTGLFAFGATSLNADVYQEGDTILVDWVWTGSPSFGSEMYGSFLGETIRQTGSRGVFVFTAPTPGEYEVLLYGNDIESDRWGRVYTSRESITLPVVVIGKKPIDYCVGNALYTDFVLVNAEWKPTPVINSPICGYTAPPPCPSFAPPYCPDGELVAQPASSDGCSAPPICVIPDEPPTNITTPPTDSSMSTTKMMLIAFIGILVVGIGAIVYSKKR